MNQEIKLSLYGILLLASGLSFGSHAKGVVAMPDGSTISQARGLGQAFGGSQCFSYGKLRSASQSSSPNVQWSLMNLDDGKVVAGSSDEADKSGTKESDKRFFGASVSKIYVGAALLDATKGKLTSAQLSKMKAMIIHSHNEPWRELQVELGTIRRKQGLCSPVENDRACGRQGVADFTRKMGYTKTRGWSGSLKGVHGNELNAKDTNKFLADTYKKAYPGADVLWNLMQGVRTGGSKAKKYLPGDLALGGKTGTYTGPTEVNGQKTFVKARNNAIVFKGSDNKQYALTILSNDGKNETVALLAGGIVSDYTGVGKVACKTILANAGDYSKPSATK